VPNGTRHGDMRITSMQLVVSAAGFVGLAAANIARELWPRLPRHSVGLIAVASAVAGAMLGTMLAFIESS
jgi:hypothetical protein